MYYALSLLPLTLLIMGFPIFLTLLVSALGGLVFFSQLPYVTVHSAISDALSKYALQAVPFFIFAGDLMSKGGISKRIMAWVESMIGGLRGNLPFTSLGFAAVFGAVSGATTATVAAVGSMTYPRMLAAGYSQRFAGALIAAEGVIDNLIPPSIAFIIYGIATDTSIVHLLAAGVLPGLVLVVCYGVYIYLVSRKLTVDDEKRFRFGEFIRASVGSLWALGAIAIILGGIYSGIFTPTEGAGVACVYAILVSWLVYREATLTEIFHAAARSAHLTALVFLIVGVAGLFGWLLTISGLGRDISTLLSGLDVPWWAMLLAMNVLLLVVGCFLDPATAMLVLTPLLLPVALSMGVDPIHFGVIVVLNLSIGTFTPPFGANIFVVQAIFKIPTSVLYPGLVPFITAAIIALLIVTYVPWLSTWLPSLMY